MKRVETLEFQDTLSINIIYNIIIKTVVKIKIVIVHLYACV